MTELMDIDLIVIGKTGNGKSATGNSILRRTAFESKDSAVSVTTMVDYEVSEFNGRVIKVVDAPGVGDTRLKNEDAIKLILRSMEYAIAANPRGYHAFLLVIRYGGRFTNEEKETIAFLKKVFGESFVRTYCILVMTCGDHFDRESDKSFQQWCSDQSGEFKELLDECDNRIVLFDNKTIDEHKRCEQITRLLWIVDNLSSQGNRYTDEHFRRAKETREQIILEAKKPIISEETLRETSLILQKFQEIQRKQDFDVKIDQLMELQTRTESLFNSIAPQKCVTEAFQELCETLETILRTISDEIRLCNRLKDEREKILKTEQEKQRMLKDQIMNERKEYERRLKEQEYFIEVNKNYETELETKKREMEEKIRQEREKMIRKFQKKMRAEDEKFQKKIEEFEVRYRQVKTENDRSFLGSLVGVIAWPFRKIRELFS